MSASIIQALNDLNQTAQSSDDEDYQGMNTVEFKKVDATKLEEAEERVGFSLPPSYNRFVLEHGTFGIGTDPAYDHMSFRLLEIDEVVTLHKRLEEDY